MLPTCKGRKMLIKMTGEALKRLSDGAVMCLWQEEAKRDMGSTSLRMDRETDEGRETINAVVKDELEAEPLKMPPEWLL